MAARSESQSNGTTTRKSVDHKLRVALQWYNSKKKINQKTVSTVKVLDSINCSYKIVNKQNNFTGINYNRCSTPIQAPAFDQDLYR